MNSLRYKVGLFSLHQYEEPYISGSRGSGTVFLSGCNMQCIYCQNYQLSQQRQGYVVTEDEFIAQCLALQEQGAHNINLVSPSHYVKALCLTLVKLRKHLNIPIVYNTSGFDTVDNLRLVDGLVDVYLTDFKYFSPTLAQKYSLREAYPDTVKAAIKEMKRQRPTDCFDNNGMLTKGVVIRHLVLPSHIEDSKKVLDYIAETFGTNTLVSLMSQYVPTYKAVSSPNLCRRITATEYNGICDYAISLKFANLLTQQRESASAEYIPPFVLNNK